VSNPSPWLWNNEVFTEEHVGDHFGFVYLITNKTNGKRYIGKKLFTAASTKTVKGKKKKVRKASDWEKYWGSSKLVQEDVKLLGEENFTREILRLCKSRSECSYYETKLIFEHDAILRANYYNSWVSCKITEVHVRALQITE